MLLTLPSCSDQQPAGERAESRCRAENDEAGAPRPPLDQKSERRAGNDHAEAADGENDTGERCEAPRRIVLANEDKRRHERRCASRSDQELPRKQHIVARCNRAKGGTERGDSERKRDDKPNAEPVERNAEWELHEAEGKMIDAGEIADLLSRDVEIGLNSVRRDGGKSSQRIAKRESKAQDYKAE